MIGVITSVDPRRRRAVIAAPYLERTVRLLKRDFQTDTPFNARLIGQPIQFKLEQNKQGWWARNAWLVSCDFMAVAADNLDEFDEAIPRGVARLEAR